MIEYFLAASLIFGGWNWWAKDTAQDKVEEQEEVIEAYQVAIDDLNRILKNNDSVLTNLEQANNDCSKRYLNILEEINTFNEASVVQDTAIQNLEDYLADSDFAECRVPDGVSLKGIETTGN